jgi:hypothetical protein
MAVIPGGFFPLNDTVTLYLSNEGSDEWGLPVKTDNLTTYKVRLEFNGAARLIQLADGKEIVYNATIFFKGSVPITYTDYIEYNSGIVGLIKAQPKNIIGMADLSGKIIYTKVIV